jgi:hypothetical protein
MKDGSSSFKSNHTPQVKLGPRLFQRLRRRLATVGIVPSEHSHQQNAWQFLYSLSLFTRESYETCQRVYGPVNSTFFRCMHCIV